MAIKTDRERERDRVSLQEIALDRSKWGSWWRHRRLKPALWWRPDLTRVCVVKRQVRLNGRNVFMGYLNMKDKTLEAFDDDLWVRSGDIGKKDDNGFLFITGRIKGTSHPEGVIGHPILPAFLPGPSRLYITHWFHPEANCGGCSDRPSVVESLGSPPCGCCRDCIVIQRSWTLDLSLLALKIPMT